MPLTRIVLPTAPAVDAPLAVSEDEDALFDAIKAGAAAFILKEVAFLLEEPLTLILGPGLLPRMARVRAGLPVPWVDRLLGRAAARGRR